jgi:hypothetical protein
MSIRELPAPCWTIRWEGPGEPTWSGHHFATAEAVLPGRDTACVHLGCGGLVIFDTAAYCTGCEEEGVPAEDWAQSPFTRAQLATPCWVASCDAPGCDPVLILGEDEDYQIHQDTRDAFSAEYIASWDWQLTGDGRICCPGHAPAANVPAPRTGHRNGDPA